MERGWKEFSAYLPMRQNIRNRVDWDAKDLLDFGKPFREIRLGFGQIESGDVVTSVKSLAKHEQVNILQAIMYDDPTMQKALQLNQLAYATKFPSGVYSEIQLTLSAQCKTKEGFSTIFSANRNAKLYDQDERMIFVNRAADQFDRLLKNQHRRDVEESIRVIYAGGGVR